MYNDTNTLPELSSSWLGELIENERDHLRRFLSRRVNPVLSSRIDASDVIQDVYVRAQQALPAYQANPGIPPLVWLRHLSAQVLSEVHRKQFRGIRSPFSELNAGDESIVMQLASSSISIASKCEKADLEAKIRSKLLELDRIDREVLEMRHIDGYSFREIASMLDIQFEAVKKRYYRALNRFKDII